MISIIIKAKFCLTIWHPCISYFSLHLFYIGIYLFWNHQSGDWDFFLRLVFEPPVFKSDLKALGLPLLAGKA